MACWAYAIVEPLMAAVVAEVAATEAAECQALLLNTQHRLNTHPSLAQSAVHLVDVRVPRQHHQWARTPLIRQVVSLHHRVMVRLESTKKNNAVFVTSPHVLFDSEGDKLAERRYSTANSTDC